MASLSRETENKRRSKRRAANRRRKAKLAKKSTLSYAELFAACGPPQR